MCNGVKPCRQQSISEWIALTHARLVVIGFVSGIIVVLGSLLVERVGIDDPVGAIAVHGVNGSLGVLYVGIFASGDYGAGWNLTTKGAAASASGVAAWAATRNCSTSAPRSAQWHPAPPRSKLRALACHTR